MLRSITNNRSHKACSKSSFSISITRCALKSVPVDCRFFVSLSKGSARRVDRSHFSASVNYCEQNVTTYEHGESKGNGTDTVVASRAFGALPRHFSTTAFAQTDMYNPFNTELNRGPWNEPSLSENFSNGYDARATGVQDKTERGHSRNLFPAPQISRKSHGKVDLSYYNVRMREEGNSHTVSRSKHPREQSSIRQLLSMFVREIQPILAKISIEPDKQQSILDDALSKLCKDRAFQNLQSRNLGIEDFMPWAWILDDKSSSICISRYVELCKACYETGRSLPPQFLGLQLLRFDEIPARSLHQLWNELSSRFLGDIDEKIDSKYIFLVRMLRHARKVDYSLFEPISEMLPRLLPAQPPQDVSIDVISQHKTVTHFCNRFLSLLALPVPSRPFGAVLVQQKAQLLVAQYMHDYTPEIHLNREGYRAFINLQLRHAKTPAEKEWARVKGPRWPPWRRDSLGISADIEYTGRQSRVMKVLQRMRDAGYSPSKHEMTAQVLTGWDTDSSPTIQVRRVMKRQPMSWLKSWISPKSSSPKPDIQHDVWAARVEATRSVREAWSSFYAYMGETEHSPRKLSVYLAMFSKLLAPLHEHQPQSNALPGDGIEVYNDAESDRDRIYVPIEPPNVEELYAQMLNDDIKPAGRLLALLLNHAPNLRRGFTYIEESSLNDTKKDVLLHAEKYTRDLIRSTLRCTPDYLFGSFINLLARRSPFENNFLFWPTSRSGWTQITSDGPVRSFHYALQILEIAESDYVPPYNALLEGLRSQLTLLRKQDVNKEYLKERTMTRSWNYLLKILNLMQQNDLVPNRQTFRLCAMIGQRVILSAPTRFGAANSVLSNVPLTIRSLFATAFEAPANVPQHWVADGRPSKFYLSPPVQNRPDLLPECKDIELLVFVLTIANDYGPILTLLNWMNENSRALTFPTSNPRSRKQMLAAIRVALEGSWEAVSEIQKPATFDQIEFDQAVELCFGWAADVDVEEFITARTDMERGMKSDSPETPLMVEEIQNDEFIDIWKKDLDESLFVIPER